MKKERRILLAGFVVLLATIAVTFAIQRLKCPNEIEIEIGRFDSKDEAMQVAITTLAAKLPECPNAKLYRIIWIGPESELIGSGMNMRCIYYSRRNKAIGYETDLYSGSFGRTYDAEEEAIREVAKKGGTLTDFKVYEESRK